MTMTYSELKQAIQDYVENDETTFVTNLPLFIRMAEERILKNVRLNLFQKTTTTTMTASNRLLAAPSDFLAPISLCITVSGDKEFLQFKESDFVQTYSPDSTTTGQPKYYAQYDVDNFLIGPTPDDNYSTDVEYYYRPASITAGAESGTSWLSENAELALLYGSLVEAYTFMKGEPELLQLYNQRMIEALARLKNLGEGQETTDEYRLGPVRQRRT